MTNDQPNADREELILEPEQWNRGQQQADFYQQSLREAAEFKAHLEEQKKVITPDDMPWEDSPQGRLKHVVNSGMDVRMETLDVYIQELPPGGASGMHRHEAEEAFFVLEGRGYDLHWDTRAIITSERYEWQTDAEPTRWEWAAGDAVFIPVNTVHQHFNADPDRPARFISATNRVYKAMGFKDIEQITPAPQAE